MHQELREKLNKWLEEHGESIFLIEGPSQIGKTHFIKSYISERRKDEWLYVDIKKNKNTIEELLVDASGDSDTFLTALFFVFSESSFVLPKTVVFDGIEYCPKLRQFFKVLKSQSDINIVAISCGGLGANHYNGLLVPSEEDVNYMMPLDFFEFMIELGHASIAKTLKESILNKKNISGFLSSKCYSLFKTYNLIGGYPFVIEDYKKNGNIARCIRLNKTILKKQFDHAKDLMAVGDGRLLDSVFDHFLEFVESNEYNHFDFSTAYKTKKITKMLEEEHIINFVSAIDLSQPKKESNAKKLFLSHQCFYYALSAFDVKSYFQDPIIPHSIVLTDFYFNQKIRNKPLVYGLLRMDGGRYVETDALIKNYMSTHVVEIKTKRLDTRQNLKISEYAKVASSPGVLLFNGDLFTYDSIAVLPSYCSCFLNEYFPK